MKQTVIKMQHTNIITAYRIALDVFLNALKPSTPSENRIGIRVVTLPSLVHHPVHWAVQHPVDRAVQHPVPLAVQHPVDWAVQHVYWNMGVQRVHWNKGVQRVHWNMRPKPVHWGLGMLALALLGV